MSEDGSWGTDEERDKPLASATGTIADITEPAAAPSGGGGPHQRTEVGGHRPLRSSEATPPGDDVSPPTDDGTWGTSSGTIGEGEDSPP
jgi:hypothetical protein